MEVGCHSFCVAYGEGIAWFEPSVRLWKIDLCDRFFVESLTRRRRVPCEESGIASIGLGDLESREFLDPRGDDTLLMAGSKEREEAFEQVREQTDHVDARTDVDRIASLAHFDSSTLRPHHGRPR